MSDYTKILSGVGIQTALRTVEGCDKFRVSLAISGVASVDINARATDDDFWETISEAPLEDSECTFNSENYGYKTIQVSADITSGTVTAVFSEVF